MARVTATIDVVGFTCRLQHAAPSLIAMVSRLVLGSVAALLLSGCASRVYFTQPLRERLEACAKGPAPCAPATEPVELQYFVSQRIVLVRQVSSRNEKVSGGRIVVRKGRLVEEVIVRRGTPGIATAWGPDWVDVSFEKGTSLRFVREDPKDHPEQDRPPASFFGVAPPDHVYKLATVPGKGTTSRIQFDGRRWEPADTTLGARLKVKRNGFTTHERRRRVLRGRRI